MFKRSFVVVVILGLVQSLSAEMADTLIAIEEVVTKGVKFDSYSMGAKLMPVDSMQLSMNQMNSVAELFSQQSLVNVTSYGPGGQAGVKIRGGGADHTTVVWNGLNLKPPMSGEINYSAINAGVFDKIVIQPGGSSTMYGSGAATGVIFLSNKLPLTNKGFHAGVGSEIGSFGAKGLNTEGLYVGGNFGSRLFISYQQTENDFLYKQGDDYVRMEHSASNNISLSQNNVFNIGSNTIIETDFWYTNLFKEVPSLRSNLEPGRTEQRDEHYYFAINAAHYGSNWFLKYRGGLIDYNNTFLGYDTAYYHAYNNSVTYINELESKFSINKYNKIFLGVNYTIDRVESKSYTESVTRRQLDFFGRYAGSFFQDKIKLNAEGRQAITDGESIPFVYSGGINYEVLNGFFLKALASKLYSLPDLNDLYWGESAWASGNRDLKPEFGWSMEYGIKHIGQIGKVSLQHEVTVYKTELNDAIIWLPDASSKWIPQNVEGTLTKGLEFTGKVNLNYNASILSFAYDYAYTNAKLSDSTKTEGELIQRRYIPENKVGLKIQYKFKGFLAASYFQVVDERYINDVSLPLEPYFLFDLYFSYEFKIDKSSLKIYTKLKNLSGTDYEIMSGYAQPGRSIYLGINYKF